MFFRSVLNGIVAVTLTSLLAACGGGGSDSNPAAGSAVAVSSATPVSAVAPTTAAVTPAATAPNNTPAPTAEAAANFAISAVSDKVVLFQGGSAAVRARVARSGGFDGPVNVMLTGLPEGVSAAAVVIGAGASEVEISLVALAAAPHSLPTSVRLEASAVVADTTQRSTSLLTLTVRGNAGMVDTSFSGGSFLTRIGDSEDYAYAATVQTDGKVLVAGSSASNQGTRIAVARYLRDGTLDASFGVAGKAIVAVGIRDDAARAIAVQADGRIVVAGVTYQRTADYDFTLIRLLPNGALDTSFGDQGRVITDFGGDSDRAFALLVMPDGRIAAGGQTNVNRTSTGVDFAIARYLPDGRLDTGFGQGGKVVSPVLPSSSSDTVRGLALQTIDGQVRLLAVGGEGDFTAARFTDAGLPDMSFGSAGRVSGLFGVNIGSAYAATVLPTGEAVIAGHVGRDFAAVRLMPDGRLDTRFGPDADGRFRYAMSRTNWDEATSIARQADGRLLLAGWVHNGTSSTGDFGVLRLTADGQLDPTFALNGTMTHAVAGAKADSGRALVLQADERVPTVRAIVAGEAQNINSDFALMRLWL